MKLEDKLKELLISIPESTVKFGNYLPFLKDENKIYISGQLPLKDGQIISGKVGNEVSIKKANQAAKLCAVNTFIILNSMGKNIDIETHLRNTIHPLQKAPQSKHIPDSSSDLFNTKHFKQTMGVDPNDLLQRPEQFDAFNPNRCLLGKNLFDNHTRQQTKDVKLN